MIIIAIPLFTQTFKNVVGPVFSLLLGALWGLGVEVPDSIFTEPPA